MDPRDFKRWKSEIQSIAKGLDILNEQLQVQCDNNEKYLREIVAEILSKTKEHASTVLKSVKMDSEMATRKVAELQRGIKEYLRGLDIDGRPQLDGTTSPEAFISQLRQAAAGVPVKVMTLDPCSVHAAVDSFLPTFTTSYRPPVATARAGITISAGVELECFVGSKIEENAEFWVHPKFSAALERELLNASIICRSRHLANGQHASFAARPDDVQAGLHCWALLDGQYYRACVENAKAEGGGSVAVQVRKVDYGASATVRCEDLFSFTEHDHEIASQAFKCHLAGSFPGRLSNNARWTFADTVKDKLLMLRVLSPVTDSDSNPSGWEVTVKDPVCKTTVNDVVMEIANLQTSQQKKTHASTDIRLLNPDVAQAGRIEKVVTVICSQDTSAAAAVTSCSPCAAPAGSPGSSCASALPSAVSPSSAAKWQAPSAPADGEASKRQVAESGPPAADVAAPPNQMASAADSALACRAPAAADVDAIATPGASAFSAVDCCSEGGDAAAAATATAKGPSPAEAKPANRGRATVRTRDPLWKRQNEGGKKWADGAAAAAFNSAAAAFNSAASAFNSAASTFNPAAGKATAAAAREHSDASVAGCSQPLGRPGSRHGPEAAGVPPPSPTSSAEVPAQPPAAAADGGPRRPRITSQSKATLQALLSPMPGKTHTRKSETIMDCTFASPDVAL